MPPMRIVVCGAAGRMGRRICELARADRRFAVAAGVDSGDAARAAPGAAPLLTESQLDKAMPDVDALVDFSSAAASVRYAALAARTRTPIVVGTTGRDPAQEKALRAFGRETPLFVAANFSPGMTLLLHLSRLAAKALPLWDPAILEVHHAGKKDAPSGTALRLAESVEAGGGRAPSIASQRAGDIVGEHALLLAGPDERLELAHRAHSRDVFARGALEAALWLRGRPAGVYGMSELLGLPG
ncbi:MAG: 4-hydroxy-tetrahydrodipicolinate reductase [Elusimicrobia bacterium]|nr:4-hydroxy-tetrahydrodipicolinate reductase [Elusimicrobiota bacterium]